MNEKIMDAYIAFQIADFDNDLVGMTKSIIDWIKVLKKEIPEYTFPEEEPPSNYYKLDPHIPRPEVRNGVRDALKAAVKHQPEDFDYPTKITNIYIVILASLYFYHLPVKEILEISLKEGTFTREDAKNLLLENNMSSNWIHEPLGIEYANIVR